jgi:KipI family sensor histidine kinase inhibitor
VSAEVTPFGDSALLVETATTEAAQRLAAMVGAVGVAGEAPSGIVDVVVGLHTVVIHSEPATDWDELSDWLPSVASQLAEAARRAPAGRPPGGPGRPALDVPVVFDGEDLSQVADELGVDAAGVAELLCRTELQVAFLGFAPGFPYLIGLPDELAAISRHRSPRPWVPGGSVAVAGGFAAVYPRASPGGWRLLGRTDVPLFDPIRPPFALLGPGDRVRFTVAERARSRPPERTGRPEPGPARSPLAARGERFIEVVEPGVMTLVEDGGRAGLAAIGVPGSGPADAAAMGLANLLVGNAMEAAALEITVVGPSLRFSRASYIAVVSTSNGLPDETSVAIDGHRHATGTVTPVGAGQVVTVATVRPGLRAYLAVAGGIATEPVLGSRSTDILSGLGPGPLRRGDAIDLGGPVRPRGQLEPAPDDLFGNQPHVIRVTAGPHGLGDGTLGQLLAESWTVATESNRVGVRLSGPRPLTGEDTGIDSVGVVTGAIQVPPGGEPIILLADHATTGGYPVVACVASVDLAKVGQLAPGDIVVFVEVGLDQARAWRSGQRHHLEDRVSGWFPTEAGT